MNYLKLVSDRGGGDVIAPPAVSVLIFVTQKPNDNFSFAFLLTFMPKQAEKLKSREMKEG